MMTDEQPEGRPPEEHPSTEPSPPSSPEAAGEPDPLQRLEEALAAKTREAAEHYDRYLRALADFENYRRRVQREREGWTRLAHEQLLRELLPVLDNLDRALQAEPTPDQLRGFVAGIELIHRELLKVHAERLAERMAAATFRDWLRLVGERMGLIWTFQRS